MARRGPDDRWRSVRQPLLRHLRDPRRAHHPGAPGRSRRGRPLVTGPMGVLEGGVGAGRAGGFRYDTRYGGIFETGGDRIPGVREYRDTKHLWEALFGGVPWVPAAIAALCSS